MKRTTHQRTPTVDRLEVRLTPSTFGYAWPDPTSLTLSFAPDGTDVAGLPSNLSNLMLSQMSTSTWQMEMLRAFQTWAAQANINIGVMADQGLPFGESRAVQGGGNEGDLRVGARPMSNSELAAATPFDPFGVWSGDVVFNSNNKFNIGGVNDGYDLYTVMLQEAGHTLGLPNSSSSTSAMYTRYLGARGGLSSEDVTNIRALYGSRSPDRFEGSTGNSAFTTATKLQFVSTPSTLKLADPTTGLEPYVAAGDLTTISDKDTYAITTKSSSFSVYLRTSKISLLQAKVSVYGPNQQLIQTRAATNPLNGDLTLDVSGATSGATYYVRVEPNVGTVFGIGSYRLAVANSSTLARDATTFTAFLSQSAGGKTVSSSSIVYTNQDFFTNETPTTTGSTFLGAAVTSSDARWDFTVTASLEASADVDVYRVIAPTNKAESVMVVTAWDQGGNGLTPLLEILDDRRTVVASEVVARRNGVFTLQFPSAKAGATYYIRVVAGANSGNVLTGNYRLAIDFRSTELQLQEGGRGALTSTAKEQAYQMTIDRNQLFHFAVATANSNSNTKAAIRMTIYDQYRRVVGTTTTRAGDSASLDLLLAPGSYTIKFSGGTEDRLATMPSLSYVWKYTLRNDPIGPSTQDPSVSPPPPTIVVVSPPPPDPYSDPYSPV